MEQIKMKSCAHQTDVAWQSFRAETGYEIVVNFSANLSTRTAGPNNPHYCTITISSIYYKFILFWTMRQCLAVRPSE